MWLVSSNVIFGKRLNKFQASHCFRNCFAECSLTIRIRDWIATVICELECASEVSLSVSDTHQADSSPAGMFRRRSQIIEFNRGGPATRFNSDEWIFTNDLVHTRDGVNGRVHIGALIDQPSCPEGRNSEYSGEPKVKGIRVIGCRVLEDGKCCLLKVVHTPSG